MIVDPSGQPLTPVDPEVERERIQKLFSDIMVVFGQECSSNDFLIVGINLLTNYIFNGPPEGVNMRLTLVMNNLGAAIARSRETFILNAKGNHSLQKDGLLQ